MNTVPFRAALLSGLLLACGPAAFSQSLTFNTLAGYAGQGSADGLSSNARFSNPSGIAADSAGNVYVADTANHTIRQITPGGAVSTLAGLAGVSGSADGTGSAALFNQPQGVAVDGAGNVYVADTGNHTIRQIAPGGVVSTLAGLAGGSGRAHGTGSSGPVYQAERARRGGEHAGGFGGRQRQRQRHGQQRPVLPAGRRRGGWRGQRVCGRYLEPHN